MVSVEEFRNYLKSGTDPNFSDSLWNVLYRLEKSEGDGWLDYVLANCDSQQFRGSHLKVVSPFLRRWKQTLNLERERERAISKIVC